MARITKKHIGRAVDFQSNKFYRPVNGTVEAVRRGVVTIRYYVAERIDDGKQFYNAEGWIAYLDATGPEIIAVY